MNEIKIICHGCMAKYEVSDFPPFSKFNCPDCGHLLCVPQYFGPYILEDKSGEGGAGCVYRALDTRTGRLTAVKIAKDKLLKPNHNPFSREIAIMEQLPPIPGVVPILEYGEITGKPFVAMPFYPGSDAESRRKAGTLPPRYRIFEAISQVANALDIARSYGVVHHDIKSSNMFFDADDNMSVGDFDTADIRADDDNLSRCPGWVTPAYSSPEKLEFGSETFKGDIFSLGVTAYELLCDHQPFSSKGAVFSLLDERRERKFPTPDKIHPEMAGEVSDLIMSMLEYDPAMRPGYQEIAVVFKMLAED